VGRAEAAGAGVRRECAAMGTGGLEAAVVELAPAEAHGAAPSVKGGPEREGGAGRPGGPQWQEGPGES